MLTQKVLISQICPLHVMIKCKIAVTFVSNLGVFVTSPASRIARAFS
jgi:hypothetical protein